MWSEFDIGTFLQFHVAEVDLRAFINAQIVHHLHRYVAHALLGRKLQASAISFHSHLRVRYHESCGVLNA